MGQAVSTEPIGVAPELTGVGEPRVGPLDRPAQAHGLVLRTFGRSLLALLGDDGVIDPLLDQAVRVTSESSASKMRSTSCSVLATRPSDASLSPRSFPCFTVRPSGGPPAEGAVMNTVDRVSGSDPTTAPTERSLTPCREPHSIRGVGLAIPGRRGKTELVIRLIGPAELNSPTRLSRSIFRRCPSADPRRTPDTRDRRSSA
jgi:hypothetical protein